MRRIVFYKDYFLDFYNKFNENVQKKIEWTLGLIRDLEKVPKKYFKHITNTDGLYEVRIHIETKIFRIFAFFDNDNTVIILNGFQKKSRKTPKKEIKLALKLMKEYFNEKE